MPANLTPEYKRAEELFREASTTEEKISALELMLQTIPKHKGTDHMQADIKRRISKLRSAPAGKSGARRKDIFHVARGMAAGQVTLLGTPNSGKSSLVANMTNAHAQVADFPFTTQRPQPGIIRYEDIQIQLIDMPPITADRIEPGQIGTYRQSDLILVTLDLSAADVTDEWETCISFLEQRSLLRPLDGDPEDELYKRLVRPFLGVCTKVDQAGAGDFAVLQEIINERIPMISVPIHDQASLDHLAERIFAMLRIIRIYTKLPGKKADMKEPFTLPIGATVYDLTYKVHRELVEKLRFARAWGNNKYPGQQIQRDCVLQDKDIVELHFT